MASPRPTVSVLTPTYNRRLFIAQYLKNVRNQDYPYARVEILIADDGDDPIQDLLKADERIRYIRLDERKPLGWKRNLLAHEARGEVLVHMDDDDYYPANRISHAVSRLMASDLQLAGASECYVYNCVEDRLVVSGPFGPNHGLDGTLAYRKEYLGGHSFDDEAMVRIEAKFTENFTISMVQLDPLSTILVMQHRRNTWDKTGIQARSTPLKLRDFIKENDDRRFYRYKVPKFT